MKSTSQHNDDILGIRNENHSNPFGGGSTFDQNQLLNIEAVYKRILFYLDEEEAYLNPKINLVNFSLFVGTNTTYLSSVVNRCFGMNFKTLINKYRVEKARQLLSERECSLEELIKLCGFSSRSILYTSFQREVGVPPSHYRREVLHLNSRVRRESK